ncbi:MAG: hypothetical protein C4521_09365 [Actinobacteria bacterium]|nr:MAG: hypothetical protein C4521_09365 [Actinomycetota bacterium]
MRILMIHVDDFKCTVTEKGRSPVVEEPESETIEMADGIVALAAVEKADEAAPEEVAAGAAKTIADHCRHLKAESLVLCSFSHLFAELGSAQVAVEILAAAGEELRTEGLAVQKTPFGWFNTFEMRAKGHPLSRVARVVTAAEGVAR